MAKIESKYYIENVKHPIMKGNQFGPLIVINFDRNMLYKAFFKIMVLNGTRKACKSRLQRKDGRGPYSKTNIKIDKTEKGKSRNLLGYVKYKKQWLNQQNILKRRNK